MQKSRKRATWFHRVHVFKSILTLTRTQLISVLSRSTKERTDQEPTQVAPCGSKGYLVPGTFLEMFSQSGALGKAETGKAETRVYHCEGTADLGDSA